VTDRVVVEADGGSRGNPGPAGYGAVVFDADSGEVLAERHESLGVETNNVAEYRGLIAGLQAARELGARHVAVRMDSKLVIEQMKGSWQVKHPGLKPLNREATQLRQSLGEVTFEWIPRERNKHADRLANQAMDRAAGKPVRPTPSPAMPVPASPATWAPPTGQPTRLVLVRHGSTVHSAEHRLSGRNDLPLDAAGEAQAAALARRPYGDVAAIVSSPLRRARQTAEAIGAVLGLSVSTNDDLAELDFGAFEGLTFAEVRARFPAEFAAWSGTSEVSPPGGESFDALARRVRRGRDAVIAAYPDQKVVVVSHVSPIKSLVRVALDAPFASFYRMHLDTASVSMLDYFADGASSMRLFNDVSHLHPTS
jgi:broad specificity phosphatase PhoE/ribonuclease HI